MARIVIFGGTGYAGSNIAKEAVSRGHEVVSYSRNLPESPVEGVAYNSADVSDSSWFAQAIEGADVVVGALAPAGALANTLHEVYAQLATAAASAGARIGFVGGAGSLQTHEGGPRLDETEGFPAEFLPVSQELTRALEWLRTSDSTIDWFYLSPAASFGAWNAGTKLGHYRLGDEILVVDEKGESFISGEDYALAFMDEIDKPAHHRARFTVAY